MKSCIDISVFKSDWKEKSESQGFAAQIYEYGPKAAPIVALLDYLLACDDIETQKGFTFNNRPCSHRRPVVPLLQAHLKSPLADS